MDALKLFRRAGGVVSGEAYSTYVTVERYGSSTSNLCRLMTVDTTTGARTKVLRTKKVNTVYDLHLGGATGGTFNLTFEGQVLSGVVYDRLSNGPNSLETDLEGLSNLVPADVTVATITGGHRITFSTAWEDMEVAFTLAGGALTGTTTTPVLIRSRHSHVGSEVTQILLGGATAGTYTVSFYGQTTSAIAFNASNSTVQTALLGLSNVNPGDVTVSDYANGFYLFWGGRYLGDDLDAAVITIADSTTGGAGVTRATVLSGSESTYAIDGTSAVPILADSYYRILVVDDTVYGFSHVAGEELPSPTSENTPLWKFTLGDPYSFVALKQPVAPNDASDKATVQYRRQPGSTTLGYKQFNWNGLADPGDSTLDETVFTAMATVGSVSAAITVSAQGAASALVPFATISPGNQNLQYSDCIKFQMRKNAAALAFDLRSVQIYFKDTNGVRVDLDTRVSGSSADETVNLLYNVYASFPPGKTRADWSTTKHFGIEMTVTTGTGTLTLDPVTLGGMPGLYVPNRDWQIGYSWKATLTGLVSGVGGAIILPHLSLRGDIAFLDFHGEDPPYMGVIPYLTLKGSSEAQVDETQIVVRKERAQRKELPENHKDQNWGQWRIVDTVTEANPTTGYTFQTDTAAFGQLAAFTTGVFEYDDIIGASQIHGYTEWLFRKNKQFTVRDSIVGDPLNLVKTDNSDLDLLDPLEGANWILSSDFKDQPRISLEVPGGNIVVCDNGAYAQSGMTPLSKSPFSRLPGSVGCAGADSVVVWRTEAGDPAVYYVSSNADAIFVIPSFAVAAGDKQFQPEELTIPLRGEVRDFLTQGSTLVNTDRMALQVDQRGDALMVVYVDRILILRRKSLIDGRRQFEMYRYDLSSIGSSWLKADFSEDLGLRAMRINGAMDEIEYDTSDSFVPIDPTWHTPSSTSVASDTVTFDGTAGHTDPAWATGFAIVARKTAGGLTASSAVYTNAQGSGVYKFYNSYTNAVAGTGTGLKNLTASIGELSEGRDDGFRALGTTGNYKAYWQSPEFDDAQWWAINSTDTIRANLDDCPVVNFYCDRNDKAGTRTDEGGTLTTPVTRTTTVGKTQDRWPLWARHRRMQVEIVLSENSSAVRGLDVWRTPAQARLNS